MPVVSQGPGGALAPPGSYTEIDSRSIIEVYGAGNTRDAVVVTVQDNIYGIIFSFTIDRVTWDEEGFATAGGEYAGVVQSIAGMQEVVGVGYTQEPDPSGLLLDKLIVTIADPTGNFQVDVTVPLSVDSPQVAVKLITDAYNTLLRNIQAG